MQLNAGYCARSPDLHRMEEELNTQAQVREVVRGKTAARLSPTGSAAGVSSPQRRAGDTPRTAPLSTRTPPSPPVAAAPSVSSSLVSGAASLFGRFTRQPKPADAAPAQSAKRD